MDSLNELKYLLAGELPCKDYSRDEIETFLETHILREMDDAINELTFVATCNFNLVHHGRVMSIRKDGWYFGPFIIADIMSIGDDSDELYYQWC